MELFSKIFYNISGNQDFYAQIYIQSKHQLYNFISNVKRNLFQIQQ
jgi:hypothetical protein